MLLNVTEYYRPESIAEAIRLLARPGVKTAPLAGGTLLTGQRDDALQAVVDLRALGLTFGVPPHSWHDVRLATTSAGSRR